MVIVAAGRSIGVSRTKKMHFEAGVVWVRRDFGQFCTGGGWEIRDVDQSRSPRNQSRLQLTPHSAAADARSCCTRIQGSAPMRAVAERWHHRVVLNVNQGGQHYIRWNETVWASDGLFVESQLSKRTSYIPGTWYIRVSGSAVYKAPQFCRQVVVRERSRRWVEIVSHLQ